LQSHSAARLSFNSTSVGFSPASVQPFFDANFYGAYPGANLSGDPFLSLVNGTSGVGLPVALAGLVANVSNGEVASLTSPTALEVLSRFECSSQQMLRRLVRRQVCSTEVRMQGLKTCPGWALMMRACLALEFPPASIAMHESLSVETRDTS